MTFIFNRWVRGADFYGREALLTSLFERVGRPTWVLGNRRVGKTSLLRQMEWHCKRQTWPGVKALYWDLQGAGSLEGLKETFLEALEDAEDLCDELDIDIDDLEDLKFSEIINKFRRKVKNSEADHLLLLMDECEELVDIAKQDAAVMATFRKLTHARGLNLVLAGSLRLMDLDETQARTSPFLPDYLPPLLLTPFSQEECVQLLTDKGLTVEVAQTIFHLSFGNPHLVQVMGEHMERLGDMELVLTALVRDKVCHYFFQSNFQCLTERFRSWWVDRIAVQNLIKIEPDDEDFRHLHQSALIRLDDHGVPEISPLLRLCEEGLDPASLLNGSLAAPEPRNQEEPKTVVKEVADKPKATSRNILDLGFMTHLERRVMAALPQGSIKDEQLLQTGAVPKNIEAIESGAIGTVLDLASPEFILGETCNQQTAVYLAGLYMYHSHFEKGPFSHIQDITERAGAIVDQDVVIDQQQAKTVMMSSHLAMIIMRSLKAKPKQRYANLEDMKMDLNT